ncbi:hypothetical protein HDV00_007428 [Rhizophlyctis rosea]|nr:hypothetical protein HDV00_007428 [Rhizophlyctis rosea]
MKNILLGITFTLGTTANARNNQGVGKLPIMGYDTYNAFNCDYEGSDVLEQARLMKQYGLVNAGYKHLILDDCYAEVERGPKGKLVANLTRFPEGMKAWSMKVKSYGIIPAPYSSNGYKTCAGYPGGYGNELRDLETWRSWGWGGLLKYDNCYIPYDNVTQANQYQSYQRMADAIDELATKYGEKPWVYSLCQWGWQNPHNWAPRIAQAWRINGDIKPFWSSITRVIWLASQSYQTFGFYQHGDMDMLEVGNNGRGNPVGDLTIAEQRTHFTAWALLKSHLLISTDLRNPKKETLDILLNKELIDINQDPEEGAPVAPFRIGAQSDFQIVSYNDTYPRE